MRDLRRDVPPGRGGRRLPGVRRPEGHAGRPAGGAARAVARLAGDAGNRHLPLRPAAAAAGRVPAHAAAGGRHAPVRRAPPGGPARGRPAVDQGRRPQPVGVDEGPRDRHRAGARRVAGPHGDRDGVDRERRVVAGDPGRVDGAAGGDLRAAHRAAAQGLADAAGRGARRDGRRDLRPGVRPVRGRRAPLRLVLPQHRDQPVPGRGQEDRGPRGGRGAGLGRPRRLRGRRRRRVRVRRAAQGVQRPAGSRPDALPAPPRRRSGPGVGPAGGGVRRGVRRRHPRGPGNVRGLDRRRRAARPGQGAAGRAPNRGGR